MLNLKEKSGAKGSKWWLTAVTGRVLYSLVQLAVNHSVLVLPQLVGGPMVSKHDHLWLFTLLTCLDIQHQFRLRVLNVEWHLHKQDRLYSREQNEAAYAGVPKTQTARLPPVHWPTDLIIQQAICTYKVRIQGC